VDLTRRQLLLSAAALLAEQWGAARGSAEPTHGGEGRKIVLVTCGGIRREDSFASTGFINIPHLANDLQPQALFFPFLHNNGVTSHYNTISSVLTGNWQRLDDWGKTSPESPTIFEFLRKVRRLRADQTWLISSNKALTNRIGASSVRDFGPNYGANVLFPKQLLINAVVHAAEQGRAVHSADRTSVAPEIEAILNSDNYDGLGWAIDGDSSSLNAVNLGTMEQAIRDLILTPSPATGDEFTFLVSLEVMKRFSPVLTAITFSDMEVAHFGSYSLHLAGISTVDRLVYELWNEIQKMPDYKDKTTLFVLPEFGRDLDGSTTNGFFNHRQGSDSTRMTWMICLGEGVRHAQTMEDPIVQTDLCATVARMLDVKHPELHGNPLPGLWI
jgi:hypothetical protein